ncbi:MAG: right-handed parallel beta-helix repeat-containing protein [Candidatus Krumholzibacteria bacterium]|nr:right-handed parallel beta-helix repeat-containing protein [Candidatus Krumholzibacteria bacterium]
MTIRQYSAAFLIALSLYGAPAHATTWHVRQDGTGDFSDISYAIGATSVNNGDTVLVGPGTYGIFENCYYLRKALHIISESGPEVTIIHNLGEPLVTPIGSTGFDVRNLSGPFTIKGFTIKWHSVGGMGGGMNGDGIDVENASGVIADNIFHANESWAVWVKGNSSVTIEGNLFYANGTYGVVIGANGAPYESIVRNNTLVDDCVIAPGDCHALIQHNILYLTSLISTAPLSNLTIECNDVWNPDGSRYTGIDDQTGVNGNISSDPLFCGVDGSGNFYLQSSSPCAGPNVPVSCSGQLMGCYPVSCTVGVKEKSWGSIKSIFGSGKR